MILFSLPPVFGTEYVLSSYIVGGTYVAIYVVGVLYLYKRFIEKVKPHYPLGFPGEPDAYFPRFNIPRPMIEDVREHPEYFEKKEEK